MGLAALGVTLEIVSPIDKPLEAYIDSAAWGLFRGRKIPLENYDPAEVSLIHRHVALLREQHARLPHSFGSYERG